MDNFKKKQLFPCQVLVCVCFMLSCLSPSRIQLQMKGMVVIGWANTNRSYSTEEDDANISRGHRVPLVKNNSHPSDINIIVDTPHSLHTHTGCQEVHRGVCQTAAGDTCACVSSCICESGTCCKTHPAVRHVYPAGVSGGEAVFCTMHPFTGAGPRRVKSEVSSEMCMKLWNISNRKEPQSST